MKPLRKKVIENLKHQIFMYNRLISVHKENVNTDYMLKLKNIINQDIEAFSVEGVISINDGRSLRNSIAFNSSLVDLAYCLTHDSTTCILFDLGSLIDMLKCEIEDYNPSDLDGLEYTVSMKLMTEKEINELPEFEGW